MIISGAELIVKILEQQGIQYIAGMPGGNNLPLYDALSKSNIKHILIKNEQAAGFIAQGIARTTGKAAVCFATSGPGATNLITAIADAHMDSIPIIAITGQVSSNLIGTDAFQEIDMYGMTLPICKHNFLVKNNNDLIKIIPDAFKIATSGRPGPVVIDIPKDIQINKIEIKSIPEKIKYLKNNKINTRQLKKAINAIDKSERPVLLIGGGVINADASNYIKSFAEKNNIPIISTLMGLGAIPNNHPLFIGMLGMHGFKNTNMIMDKADLIIAVGTRFGDRSTGNVKAFCKNAKIIHIDIDSSEINKIKRSNIAICGDAREIIKTLTKTISQNNRVKWINYIKETKQKVFYSKNNDKLHPANIIKHLSKITKDNSIIVTDVGQHQMWTAQYYQFKHPRTFLTSGGLGTMGFGLPTAIGAALANPDKQIICITGDGSILMNIQELATIGELDINLKIIVLNNQHLGLVKQQQSMFYKQNIFASKFDNQYNFSEIANAFGINGTKISTQEKYSHKFEKIIDEKGAHIIDIDIHEDHHVLPIVTPGKGNTDMIE